MNLLLRNCTVIDANSPEPRRVGDVLIVGDTIADTLQVNSTNVDRVIDLDGAYLLPGLWDVHTHLRSGTWDGRPSTESQADAVLAHARNAMDALTSGVTGLRVVGIAGWADVALRRAFERGMFMGPRLVCCGRALRPSAGHSATLSSTLVPDLASLDGPTAFVRAVRENIKHDVDQTKLLITGGIMGAGHDVMSAMMMMDEELEAATSISNRRGVPVAAHATSPEAVKRAVKAGAHSIEHGYILDEEAAALMAKNGVYYVPTLALSHLTIDQASTAFEVAYCRENPLPDQFKQRANRFAPGHEESLRLALEAGVKIASGSDQGPPREAALLEIELLARCGLGAHGALTAATRTAAEVCKMGDVVGTIQPGHMADLLAVSGNPIDDIHNLRRTVAVIKGGRIVVDDLLPP